MQKIFNDDIKYIISKNYQLKVYSVNKKKSFYICDTNEGYYKFRQTYCTTNEILFQNEIKNHLENNFENTDIFYLSNKNLPFITNENKNYIMTKYYDYDKVDFKNQNDFKTAIKQIAIFHKSLYGIRFCNYATVDSSDIFLDIDRNILNFYKIKKFLKNQNNFSDFDIYFLKNFDYYIYTMQYCKNLLISSNYNDIIAKNASKNIICHNRLKQENILIDQNNIYITNFDECRIRPQIYDLSFLIRRYTKSLPNNYININEIVDIYSNNNDKMTLNELKILYPLLKYPKKFIKLTNEYYFKKRTWVPNKFYKKLNELVENKDLYDIYIKRF